MSNKDWYQKIESTSRRMQTILQVYAIENNIEEDFSGKPSHDLHSVNFKEVFNILENLRECELKELEEENKET